MAAINQVALTTGADLSPERKAAIALALDAGPGGSRYTVAQVCVAARELCLDVELAKALRYGYTLAAADFRRVIEEAEEAGRIRPPAQGPSEAQRQAALRAAVDDLAEPLRDRYEVAADWTLDPVLRDVLPPLIEAHLAALEGAER